MSAEAASEGAAASGAHVDGQDAIAVAATNTALYGSRGHGRGGAPAHQRDLRKGHPDDHCLVGAGRLHQAEC